MLEILAADADNEYAMIDSTIVRAHQHSAGATNRIVGRRTASQIASASAASFLLRLCPLGCGQNVTESSHSSC